MSAKGKRKPDKWDKMAERVVSDHYDETFTSTLVDVVAAVLRCVAKAARPSAQDLANAWTRYVELFGEPPHGTLKQIAALLKFVRKR